MSAKPVRFGVIGVNHNHIHGMTDLLLKAGAELVACFAAEADLAADFVTRYPQARLARSADEVLNDETIDLIASAAISSERAGVGLATLRHGKDFLSDKPGFTSLDQLAEARQVQRETGRIYSVCYSERFPESGHGARRRARRGWRDWPPLADHRTRTASAQRA